MTLRRWTRAGGLLAGALLAAACGRPGRLSSRTPVVLISIDTLRADHLPAYGYKDVRTPAIDSLCSDAILFRNAYSHVPLTFPSHTTLLTGLLPPQSGVRDNIGFELSPKHVTLATLLKSHGFATGAAVSSVVLTSRTGISRGFDFYDDEMAPAAIGRNIGDIQRSGFETEAVAEKWIAAHDGGPFFFFLHLYEPHSPYTPPEPFKSIYKDRPYDGEIATADAIVGKFLGFLKSRGTYGKCLLVLVSDHGEGLNQHGEREHGILLYRETLHVPLLVKLPGQQRSGSRVDRPVALTDVFPTVAEALGLTPPAGVAGRSLLEGASGATERRIYSETYYPRYHFGWSDLASLTDAGYQYIHGAREEIYDLRRDPGETENLAPALPPPFRVLRNALLSMDRPMQAPGPSDPEQVKKLAALGYLGTAHPSDSSQQLEDPRDHLGEVEAIQDGLRLTEEGHFDEAISTFRHLVGVNPGMFDAWNDLANALYKAGRLDEALRALLQADRLQPGSAMTLGTIARIYLDLGDGEKARLSAERAIAAGDSPEGHQVLASMALHRKELAEAERQANLARGGYHNRWQPEMILAEISKARGDLVGALRQLDAIDAELQRQNDAHVSTLEFLRGDILARLGRNAEAEAAFREETRRFPQTLRAWTGLALLYASAGRQAEAFAALEQMMRQNPSARAAAAAEETLKILGDEAGARRVRQLARQIIKTP